jgi:hypothetical protein
VTAIGARSDTTAMTTHPAGTSQTVGTWRTARAAPLGAVAVSGARKGAP